MAGFIPIDVMSTQPAMGGGGGLPDGFYIVQVTDASEVRPEQNQQHARRLYKLKVLMGPNASQDCANKPFTDGIRETDPSWAPQHMGLFVACFGSVDAVRAAAAQFGGGIPPEALVGRTYIMQATKGEKYTNITQRLPYTPENWNACIGGNGARTATPAAQSPSPAGGLLVQQPGMPPAAPQFQAPAFQAPPMQMPGAPQMYAAPAVPTAPQQTFNVPPPPPGFPAAGK